MTIFHRICKFTAWPDIVIQLRYSFMLSSCSGLKTTPAESLKTSINITGKPGGIKLSDLGKKDNHSDSLPVNALLWRAALDIASFVPWMMSIHLVAASLPNGTSPKTHLISV